MTKEQLVIVSSSDKEITNQPDSLSEFFSKCLYYWPLFVLSLALCGSAAYFYLKTTKSVYEIKSKLLIKDEKSVATERSPLEELNVTVLPKTVENEIEILKSRDYISKTIESLQLWTSYSEKKEWGSKDLFQDAPFQFKFVAGVRDSLDKKVFEVTVLDKETYVVRGLQKQLVKSKFRNINKSDDVSWKLDTTKNIGNYIGKTVKVEFTNSEKLINQYQNGINASLVNKLSPVVELTMDDYIPQRGVKILNSLMATYNAEVLNDKNKVITSTLRFIDDRLQSLTGELSDVEKNVEGFKSSRGMTDISSKAQMFLQNVQSNDSQLNDINVQLDVVRGIERFVNMPNGSGNPPATLGISDPGLVSLVDQLSKLQLQKIRLSATTPEQNPIFEALNHQIKSTKDAIRENLSGIKTALVSTQTQLRNNNLRYQSSIKDIPGQERQYTDIKRQQEIKANLYVYLLQKKEEVALRYASTLTDARIIDNAYYDVPKSPKKQLIFAIALVLALIMPAGFIFAKDLIRAKVTNKNEIETMLDIPIISELAYHKSNQLLQLNDRNNLLILEQFRELRTKLKQLHTGGDYGRVILCTSSVAGEGKSFVISNLGIFLAASERRTVIVELDLRRPSLANLFKLDPEHPGVADYLSGKAPADRIIQFSENYPNLDIISCGTIPSQPSELLGSDKLIKLFTWLRESYDDILIDTPPVHLVSDALVLDQFCDSSIYVIRQGTTSKSELSFIKQLNREKNFKNMNIVFNGINRKKHGYGYKYDASYYQ